MHFVSVGDSSSQYEIFNKRRKSDWISKISQHFCLFVIVRRLLVTAVFTTDFEHLIRYHDTTTSENSKRWHKEAADKRSHINTETQLQSSSNKYSRAVLSLSMIQKFSSTFTYRVDYNETEFFALVYDMVRAVSNFRSFQSR